MNKGDRFFLSLTIIGLVAGLFMFFTTGYLVESKAKDIGLIVALFSAGLLGFWIYIKGRIHQDLFEWFTTGKITFKGFGKGKFKSEHLKKEGTLRVSSQDGFWFCPSCNEKNKEIQDVCSNCGQEIEKDD